MSTTTENYKFIKPDLTDAADITATNPNWDRVDQVLNSNTLKIDKKVDRESTYGLVTMGLIQEGDKSWETIEMKDSLEADLTSTRKIPAYLSDLENDVEIGNTVYTATSTDGINYTITDDRISELYEGMLITIYPSRVSTSTRVYLSVNGSDQKQIWLSGGELSNYGTLPRKENWIQSNSPMVIMYRRGSGNLGPYWYVQSMYIPPVATADLSGLMSAEDKVKLDSINYTYGTEDLTAGTSELETGKIYFVYE